MIKMIDKKIYYISDWHINPGNYKFGRHRFPQAYIELAPWYIINWSDINKEITGENNIILVNTPVHDELNKLKIIDSLIDNNDIYIIQEGSVWCWMDWGAPEQELYIKLLSQAKAFLCSNKFDGEMMSLFTCDYVLSPPCTNFFIDEDRKNLGDYIFIVNPYKGYQKGMMSHKLVYDSAPKGINIYSLDYDRSPHIGRNISVPDSYSMPGFKKLKYMQHNEFVSTVYNSRFGVDIHRDFSAGQTAVDFGSLGVPLVGNIKLDAQREIFPDISFEWNDYDNIKKHIKLLSIDDDFCKEVGKKALENTKLKYNSLRIVSDFVKEFNKTLNK